MVRNCNVSLLLHVMHLTLIILEILICHIVHRLSNGYC